MCPRSRSQSPRTATLRSIVRANRSLLQSGATESADRAPAALGRATAQPTPSADDEFPRPWRPVNSHPLGHLPKASHRAVVESRCPNL